MQDLSAITSQQFEKSGGRVPIIYIYTDASETLSKPAKSMETESDIRADLSNHKFLGLRLVDDPPEPKTMPCITPGLLPRCGHGCPRLLRWGGHPPPCGGLRPGRVQPPADLKTSGRAGRFGFARLPVATGCLFSIS